MSRRFWFIGGIVMLIFAGLSGAAQVILPRVLPLPVYATLPELTLRDQDNRPFDLARTRGQIVVLSVVYTHCPDICPLTTARLHGLQTQLQQAGLSHTVYFVSFTIDPARDLPLTLKRFAEAQQVDFSNWSFLAGSEAQTQTLIQTLSLYVERVYDLDGTLVPAGELSRPAPPGTDYLVNHTDRVFIVDRKGDVRAFEPGSTADLEQAKQWIRQLQNEPN